MKILMLAEDYPPIIGGGGRHVQSLSRKLARRGHEVIVCAVKSPGLPEYEQEAGVKIERLQGFFQRIPFLYKDPMRRWHPPVQDCLLVRQLKLIIREEKPDIIHAHGLGLYSALSLKKSFDIPLVATLHGYGFLCPKRSLFTDKSDLCDEPFTRKCIACGRGFYGLVKSLAAYYGVKTSRDKLKSVDKFIAVSSFVKDVHSKHLGLGDRDIVMIPNFYDPEIGRQQKKAVDLAEDFILFVGELAPYKGVDLLIEAYQKVNAKAKLVLIGGKHPDYHYKSTEAIPVIENAPYNVVMEAMSRCRFAVFPSIWADPCPTVAFEAMCQRKAVITSSIGGLKDIVVDGETGILVPPNDSDKLAEAISYLLERPQLASKMGAKGYQRFIENYTADVVISVIIDLYKSLIQGGHK